MGNAMGREAGLQFWHGPHKLLFKLNRDGYAHTIPCVVFNCGKSG